MFNLFRKPKWEELMQVAQESFASGQSKKAEKILEKALNLVSKSDESAVQVEGYRYIGLVFCAEKRYSQAQDLLEKSLELGETYYGEGNPILLAAWSELKAVYEVQGKMEQYEICRSKMLEIQGNDEYCI